MDASLGLSHQGSCASDWLSEMLRIYKETGYEVFSGRTEWIMGLLLEGKAEKSEEWMTHFSGGRLMDDILRWITRGGYRQIPVVKIFPPAVEQHVSGLVVSKFSEEMLAWRKDCKIISESLPN